MRTDGSIDGFAALLGQAGLDLGAEEMADALWLAGYINSGISEQITEEEVIEEQSAEPTVREDFLDSELKDDVQLPLSLPPKQDSCSAKPDGIPIKAPAAPALRIRLELARALRPLRRRVPSPVRMEFDQAATIERIADQGIWSPVLSPAPERWLELALVIEESKSAPLWKETLAEFQTLLERQGAFRTVSFWRLKSSETGELTLLSGNSNRPRSARELLDPAGRRLILVVSDCTSVAWQRGTIYPWLKTWGEQAPMTVIQLLPERLWAQTGLAHGTPIWLSALEPGVPSARMMTTAQMPLWNLLGSTQDQVVAPVVSLEAEPLQQWAKVVSGVGENRTVGFRFEKREIFPSEVEGEEQPELSAEDRVRLFRATASMTAQKLARLMSAAPVSPPIVNLIRQTMLPEAEPVHVAEVYMGGLIKIQENNEYDFFPGVRDKLVSSLPVADTEKVLKAVSTYISRRIGLNLYSFETLLGRYLETSSTERKLIGPFAQIAASVLSWMGGDYARIFAQLDTSLQTKSQFTTTPKSQSFSQTIGKKNFRIRKSEIFNLLILVFSQLSSKSLTEKLHGTGGITGNRVNGLVIYLLNQLTQNTKILTRQLIRALLLSYKQSLFAITKDFQEQLIGPNPLFYRGQPIYPKESHDQIVWCNNQLNQLQAEIQTIRNNITLLPTLDSVDLTQFITSIELNQSSLSKEATDQLISAFFRNMPNSYSILIEGQFAEQIYARFSQYSGNFNRLNVFLKSSFSRDLEQNNQFIASILSYSARDSLQVAEDVRQISENVSGIKIFHPINPFWHRAGQIDDPELFWGRERELNEVFDNLNSGMSAALIGEREIGKSSILRAIQREAPKKLLASREPLYVNLHDVSDEEDFYDELCHVLAIKPCKGSRFRRAVENKRVLLLLDEIERITWKGFTNQIRSQLRGLSEGYDSPFKLVVAASKSLEKIFPDTKHAQIVSPLAGICLEIALGPWTKAEVREFIRVRLDSTDVAFSSAEIEQICQNTEGKPRQVMVECYELYTQKLSQF